MVVLAAGFFLVVLGSVSPYARGYGTHEALGMAACSWPLDYDAPCVTCGVTTAACYLVHLSPIKALVAQPFGAVLTGFSLVLAGIALLSLLRRRSFIGRIASWPLPTLILSAAALLLLSWLYKYFTWE